MIDEVETVEKYDPFSRPQVLPSADQLSDYLILKRRLLESLETVRETDKKAFCDLILGLDPGLLILGPEELDLAMKLFPEEWKRYGAFHWGELHYYASLWPAMYIHRESALLGGPES